MAEETPKKKQTMRYSEEELQLIKSVFAENDELLKAIRKVFYQLPLTALDLSLLSIAFAGKEEVKKILRKTYLPEITGDLPIQQNFDLWLTLHLKDMPVAEAAIHIKSVKIWIDYIEQQLKVIEKGNYGKKQKIVFNKLVDIKDKVDWDMYADMLARNTIINHTEQQLRQLQILAGLKTETTEETIERISKDSNK
jgi:hypothetical protein